VFKPIVRIQWLPIVTALAATAVHAQVPADPPRSVEQVMPLVNQYCGSCHAVPSPSVLPKKSWPGVIRNMVALMQDRTGRAQLSEAQMQAIIALYYGSSPEELPKLPYLEPAAAGSFVAKDIGARSTLPFVTHLNAMKPAGRADAGFLVCDGEAQRTLLLTRSGGRWSEQPLAEVTVPVHTDVVDIDRDGDLDVLVADLGLFPPLESLVGKLFLLRQVAAGKFEKELLLEGVGRLSDARALDLDADGDLDIAVAAFGGKNVGGIFWLENAGTQGGRVTYRRHELMDIGGAITVTPADLDADGKPDLVSLIAQEHEMIVAFVNRGAGNFDKGVIARAPHPMYGSTSLSTVDLDRDGDVDVLFTNGDAFDHQTDPKPYHGVQWLENKGGLQFEFHDIGRLYGAASAATGDLDRDGDLDVVVGSWVNDWNDTRRHSLAWYENDGRQRFKSHGIATGPPGVVSIQLQDLNGDATLDIVAGVLRMDLIRREETAGTTAGVGRKSPAPGESAPHSRVLLFENHLGK
jgi:hypothetical protein